MSYKTKSSIHSYLFVNRITSNVTINTTSYGVDAADGFPFNSTAITGGDLTWNSTSYIATIKTKGLYLVSYSYSLFNNSTGGNDEETYVGVNHTRGTTYTYYYQFTNPEYTNGDRTYNVGSAIVINCNVDDIIKGCVYKATTNAAQIIHDGASLSIALIAPFS